MNDASIDRNIIRVRAPIRTFWNVLFRMAVTVASSAEPSIG